MSESAETEMDEKAVPKARRARRASKKAEKTLTQEMAALLAKTLLPDLSKRARQPTVETALRQRWEAETQGRRTAATFAEWVDQTVEQVGAAWILSSVFVRVLEDRGYLDRRRIAGDGADDSLRQFVEIAPSLTERDYLLLVFRELAEYPGAADVLGPAHNPAWRLSPSNDSVRALLGLLKQTREDGQLQFQFEGDDTRFLGDLYQDLSEGVRKRYALLQTPDFVERFILDQTLEPAIREFGLEEVRLIDPTCGSGHFLLGAFHRIFDHRLRAKPAVDPKEHAAAALAQVWGVDVNPYAVSIACFRLTLAYLEHAGIRKLEAAPRIEANVIVADSLLHGLGQTRLSDRGGDRSVWGDDMFALEDPPATERVLAQRYHAVVGNPPYIVCRDRALREEYAKTFRSCWMNYALGVPFTERFFGLAEANGFVGMINANSFVKREFGKRLIESVLPTLDITSIIDTSGAYIPGHGTPTILLFGRNRSAALSNVVAVLGKRGEPGTPSDPSRGAVWFSIAEHHHELGFENEYISVAALPRDTLARHPWSLSGGGAPSIQSAIESRCNRQLRDVIDDIGFSIIIGEDDLFLRPAARSQWGRLPRIPIIVGEDVRDWSLKGRDEMLRPFSADSFEVSDCAELQKELWPWKAVLRARVVSGSTTMAEANRKWFDVRRLSRAKHTSPMCITFAEVATHNHFALDRGGKVFKQTAPIIKLPPSATEDDHLALLAYLNSSTACFWMKQVFMNKGGSGVGRGIQDEAWEARYQFDGTKLSAMPIPGLSDPVRDLAREVDGLAQTLHTHLEAGRIDDGQRAFGRMVALQEDLDWEIYAATGLINSEELATVRASRFDTLHPGNRAFEYLIALRGLDGEGASAWFKRNEYTVPTLGDIPDRVGTRLRIIDRHPELQVIEQPEYKRRWTVPAWDGVRRRHLRAALLARIEELTREPRVESVRALVARASQDSEVQQCIEDFSLAGDPTVSLVTLFFEEAVPFVAGHRYTDTGLNRHGEWNAVWDLQRREDAGETVTIPVPERYGREDYASPTYWALRGKLDVPKERFISYPGCERDDDKSPLIGWAGWDHLQRAQALATLFTARKDQDGWGADRLTPVLAGLLELVPWIKQWHNDPNDSGTRAGDAYEAFVSENARALSLTLDDLRSWRPEKSRRRAPRGGKPKS